MNETTLTMAGNLVADPELRYTPTGAAVVNLRIASTERFKGEGGWQDGDTLFMTVTAWRALAENVAESASKGTRVIVTGRLKQRSYDTREGGRATVYELDAADVGISLQRTTAKPVMAER
jgi:single-strand DNA-binding protein